MTNLTNLELAALRFLGDEGLDCMGGSEYADLLTDNMACAFASEIGKALKIGLQAVGGVMSSLQQKGLARADEISDGKDGFWLTDDGIRVLSQRDAAPVEIEESIDFKVTITGANGFSAELNYTGDRKEVLKKARQWVKDTGSSRKNGALKFRVTKA